MKVLHKIRLQAKARSNYFEMRDESSLKNVDALVLYFVYGSGDEFQVAKEWKQARICLCWTLAVPDVLSKLFVYICLCLIFCHSKKKVFPEKANIRIVSGGKINAVHQTVALKSQCRLENELEAELIHRLDERSNILESCWLQLLLLMLKESGRFMAGCGGTDCKEPEEAVQSPWQLEEALGNGVSPRGNTTTDTNRTIKDAGYYILSYLRTYIQYCTEISLTVIQLYPFGH